MADLSCTRRLVASFRARGGEYVLEGPGSESLDPQVSSIFLAPPALGPPAPVVDIAVGVDPLSSSSTSLRNLSNRCRGLAAEAVVGGVRYPTMWDCRANGVSSYCLPLNRWKVDGGGVEILFLIPTRGRCEDFFRLDEVEVSIHFVGSGAKASGVRDI